MPEDGSFGGAAGVRLQRAAGRAEVTLGLRRGATRLVDLHQEGAAKAFLPQVPGPVPEVVFLNTAGGLTGGDRLGFALTLGPGAAAVGTTQTAERAYASVTGRAQMVVRLRLGAGAALDWLPQETILFDRSTLSRRTVVEMGADARFLMAETVMLGRAAMGETVRNLLFTDWREVRQAGRSVLAEPLRITAETLRAGPAALGGARALATVALVAADAGDALAAVRAALGGDADVEAAASAWEGRLVARVLGRDLLAVKHAVARALTVLRGRALPRVWQM